jgi:hypothetical protein
MKGSVAYSLPPWPLSVSQWPHFIERVIAGIIIAKGYFIFCVGLSLSEIGNNRTSNNKVVCCHFSSDGKLLASAGHEKKVKCSNLGYIW